VPWLPTDFYNLYNISYWTRPDAIPREVEQASRLARIHDFINRRFRTANATVASARG